MNVTLQKSTNKLFVQADYDFINFLFGLLTVPFGRVEWVLGSNTGLKNMDNLHRSIADDSNNKQLKNPETKYLLIQSNYSDALKNPETNDLLIQSNCSDAYGVSSLNFSSSRILSHVKEASMYMVNDDLTVAPLGVTSLVSMG